MGNPLQKALAASLSLSLAFSCAGSEAWAAVLRVAAPAAPISPSAAAGASAVTAGISLAREISSGRRVVAAGVLPASPAPQTLPLPSASPEIHTLPSLQSAPARARPAFSPAGEDGGEEASRGRASARGLAEELGRRSAGEIASVKDAGSSPADLHGASRRLEDLLTGRRTSGEAEVPAPAGERSRRYATSHLSHEHFEISEAAPGASRVPAPEISPEHRRQFRRYKIGVSAVKTGIETMHIAIPLLVLTVYGSAATVGGMVIGGNLASLAAGWLASAWVDRTGPAKVLAATAALQAVTIGLIPALYAAGVSFGFPLVAGLYITSGALSGIFDIARRAEMPHILGRDEGVLREYNGRLYIWREVAGIAGDVGSGLLAKSAGFLTALWLHPVSYALAAYNFTKLALAQRGAEARTPSASERESLRAKLGALFDGARIVLRDPYLRTAALINVPVLALHQLFHTMLAAVYAAHVLGNPMLAAVMIAAWNFGELASAWWLKKHGKAAGSSFKWLKLAAVAGLSSWLLWAAPSIWVAAPVAFLIAAATLSNELGLASFFQARSQQEDVGKVTGFVYSASTAVSMAVLYAMGLVFDVYGAASGFFILAAAMSLLAVLYYLSWRVLRRLPPQSAGAQEHGHFH